MAQQLRRRRQEQHQQPQQQPRPGLLADARLAIRDGDAADADAAAVDAAAAAAAEAPAAEAAATAAGACVPREPFADDILAGLVDPSTWVPSALLPQQDKSSPAPLSAKVLDVMLQRRSLTNLSNSFAQRSQEIAPPRDDDFRRPAPYQTRCRGLCGSSDAKVLAMQASLLTSWSRVGPKALKQDILLKFEVGADGQADVVVFGLLSQAAGRHGRFPAQASFLLYHTPLVLDAECNGLVSQPRRLPAVQIDMSLPRIFHPFVVQDVGEYDVLPEGDFVAFLLESQLPAEWPSQVKFHRVKHRPYIADEVADFEGAALLTEGFYAEDVWPTVVVYREAGVAVPADVGPAGGAGAGHTDESHRPP